MGQSGVVVQSVLGYLCNRAVGEEQHKVDSGLLQSCSGGARSQPSSCDGAIVSFGPGPTLTSV